LESDSPAPDDAGAPDFEGIYQGEKVFIDAMGNIRASEFWEAQEPRFLQEISEHLDKVTEYISKLDAAEQEQIIRIGF
jgi:hypothetical protein